MVVALGWSSGCLLGNESGPGVVTMVSFGAGPVFIVFCPYPHRRPKHPKSPCSSRPPPAPSIADCPRNYPLRTGYQTNPSFFGLIQNRLTRTLTTARAPPTAPLTTHDDDSDGPGYPHDDPTCRRDLPAAHRHMDGVLEPALVDDVGRLHLPALGVGGASDVDGRDLHLECLYLRSFGHLHGRRRQRHTHDVHEFDTYIHHNTI